MGAMNSSHSNCPGVNGSITCIFLAISRLLEIAHDLNIRWPSVGPAEAHAPLIVDADAHLTPSIPLERLQAIARWNLEVIQSTSNLKLSEFPASDRLDSRDHRVPRPPRPPHSTALLRPLLHPLGVQIVHPRCPQTMRRSGVDESELLDHVGIHRLAALCRLERDLLVQFGT